jgi:TRAP-type C4-dicarboxylate transport system permease small subunit
MGAKRAFEHVFQAMTAVLMIAMVGLTLLQVISRYALEISIPWTEELARLDLIYLTFIGSIVACQQRSHLKVEMLTHALPPAVKRWLAVIIDCVSLMVLGAVVWTGAPLLRKFWPVLSAALQWPTSVFYFAVVFGCSVLCVYTALDLVAAFRGTQDSDSASPGKETAQ